jgi:hemolysin III
VRKTAGPERKQSPTEEVFNTATCGIGFCLSVAALAVLVVFASLQGGAVRIASFSIYGTSLVLLFASSTLYHWIRSEKVKYVFQILDHCAIYFLIAGTYTPFTLIIFKGAWGWSLFGTIWGLALAGIVFKIFFVEKFRILSVIVYLLMGWLVMVAFQPLVQNLAPGGIVWLVAGGFFYTLGLLFYAWEKLPFHHVIWHLFVMVGCGCHFFSILFYVLPD